MLMNKRGFIEIPEINWGAFFVLAAIAEVGTVIGFKIAESMSTPWPFWQKIFLMVSVLIISYFVTLKFSN